MVFPSKTLEWMIARAAAIRGFPNYAGAVLYNNLVDLSHLNPALKHIWFGYYMCVGENLKLWTVGQVLDVMHKNCEMNDMIVFDAKIAKLEKIETTVKNEQLTEVSE